MSRSVLSKALGYSLVFVLALMAGRSRFWENIAATQFDRTVTGGYGIASGEELVFVYIGSPACSYCLRPEVQASINSARRSLKQRSALDSLRFVTHGISVSWDPVEGFNHLVDLGGFDEISVGRNWFNEGARRYLWSDFRGAASTPQVLVLRRTVTSPLDEEIAHPYEIVDARLLVRKVGSFEIQSWERLGAPLPLQNLSLEPSGD